MHVYTFQMYIERLSVSTSDLKLSEFQLAFNFSKSCLTENFFTEQFLSSPTTIYENVRLNQNRRQGEKPLIFVT